MKYIIYTDGACSGNPGPGGWAIVVIDHEENILHSTSNNAPITTNNQMELEAFLAALTWCAEYTDQNDDVIICTDSAYIYNCFNDKWYEKWLANGWKNASKQPVANKELWQAIFFYWLGSLNKYVILCKVHGHSGNKWNEYVDELAVIARQELNK